MPQQVGYMFDGLLLMKDAGLVAASAAAKVASADKIVDLGAGRVEGSLIVQTTAVEVADGDELFSIKLQVSDVADFSTGSPKIKNVATVLVGDSSKTGEDADSPGSARYEAHFTNEVNGVVYRYARVYTLVAGTVTVGVNYTAFLSRSRNY